MSDTSCKCETCRFCDECHWEQFDIVAEDGKCKCQPYKDWLEKQEAAVVLEEFFAKRVFRKLGAALAEDVDKDFDHLEEELVPNSNYVQVKEWMTDQPKTTTTVWPEPSEEFSIEELVSRIHTMLGCTEPLTKEVIFVALKDIRTFDGKQHDYGSNNIAKFGEEGVLVRASDKLERLINLSKKPNEEAANESIDDSWADLSVYGMIARLVRAGKWPI